MDALFRSLRQISQAASTTHRRRFFSSLSQLEPMAFIGGGKMSEAIITGLLAKQAVTPEQIRVTDPNPTRRQLLSEQKGIRVSDSNQEVVDGARLVVFCNKPQHCDSIFEELRGKIHPKAVILSICAGVTSQNFQNGLGNDRIVRTMPNTPAMVQGAMTVWTATPQVSKDQTAAVASFLSTFGEEEKMSHESYLDMATALSGSGPAYFFLLIESLVDAGVHMGFPRSTAEKLVRQTALGSATYASKFPQVHPTVLRNDITSPGGTTAAALYAADKGNFRNVVSDAVWAAYDRSKELGALGNENGSTSPSADKGRR